MGARKYTKKPRGKPCKANRTQHKVLVCTDADGNVTKKGRGKPCKAGTVQGRKTMCKLGGKKRAPSAYNNYIASEIKKRRPAGKMSQAESRALFTAIVADLKKQK